MKYTIDWHKIPVEYNYVAVDGSGKVFAYNQNPIFDSNSQMWVLTDSHTGSVWGEIEGCTFDFDYFDFARDVVTRPTDESPVISLPTLKCETDALGDIDHLAIAYNQGVLDTAQSYRDRGYQVEFTKEK